MKNLKGLLTRSVLLLALVVALVPSWATETVCALSNGKSVAPMVKCHMGGCAHRAVAPPPNRDCCAPKDVAEKVSNMCGMANQSCRCETRLVSPIHPAIAALVEGSAQLYSQPAILPQVFQLPAPNEGATEPGIYGVDPGPPRKVLRSFQQARAPPVFV